MTEALKDENTLQGQRWLQIDSPYYYFYSSQEFVLCLTKRKWGNYNPNHLDSLPRAGIHSEWQYIQACVQGLSTFPRYPDI
jgi:hypothetical protein